MPNINTIPVLTTATSSTFFVVTDGGLSKRINYSLISNPGPQGSQGRQGSQGFQGTAGNGTQGSQGRQGSQGDRGIAPAFTNVPVPASSTSVGIVGQVAFDDTYLYICVSTNQWKRVYSPSSSSF
jgi:hypothetical protein